ncbi:PH domain-containing protein [Marinobacter gelidimuriae]|uniref:PH domain-containing protein n=1 Tax=Marinobacter gelidimuriae TaxID=2739064 RepID=UPI0003624C2F|nr:PH domain-containing protein [Marinobacter gelidimuriae]
MGIVDHVTDHLAEDEQVVYQTPVSWIVVGVPLLLMLLSMIVLSITNRPDLSGDPQAIVSKLWNLPFQLLYFPAMAGAAFGALLLVMALVERLTTEVTITTRRVIYETGLISRRSREINRSVIEGVDVWQWIPGRVLNYATVTINGIGSGSLQIRALDNPWKFREHLVKRTSRKTRQ